jgi:hypothetical protein
MLNYTKLNSEIVATYTTGHISTHLPSSRVFMSQHKTYNNQNLKNTLHVDS